jgi:hypothetical protein
LRDHIFAVLRRLTTRLDESPVRGREECGDVVASESGAVGGEAGLMVVGGVSRSIMNSYTHVLFLCFIFLFFEAGAGNGE